MINERLRLLRKEFNVTQNKVASYIGVARATYTNYESGKKKPPYEQLIRLSRFFNVSTDYLLGVTDIKDLPCKLNTTENNESTNVLFDKDIQTAFADYNNWTVKEKEDLLDYIEFQKMKRNKKLNKNKNTSN